MISIIVIQRIFVNDYQYFECTKIEILLYSHLVAFYS